jgi:hypothetical protein
MDDMASMSGLKQADCCRVTEWNIYSATYTFIYVLVLMHPRTLQLNDCITLAHRNGETQAY